jgi:hypothetical protein
MGGGARSRLTPPSRSSREHLRMYEINVTVPFAKLSIGSDLGLLRPYESLSVFDPVLLSVAHSLGIWGGCPPESCRKTIQANRGKISLPKVCGGSVLAGCFVILFGRNSRLGVKVRPLAESGRPRPCHAVTNLNARPQM